jgi:sortase A
MGNLAIAGHRDTFFRALRGIRADDVIWLTSASGSFVYRVQSIRIVAPTETEVLASTAQPTLTLITCYPFVYIGHAPNRFVVTAQRVSSGSKTAANDGSATLGIPQMTN